MPGKILFLVPYPYNKAPSQRLKFEQYYPHLEAAGFNVAQSSFMSLSMWSVVYKKGKSFLKLYYTIGAYIKRYWVLLSIRKYDLVYVHLWGTPLGLPIYEWLLSKLAKKMIYDIDDLIFLGKASSSNSIISFMKGRGKSILLMKHANHVITCTPYLDAFVRRYNPNTTDISSTINTATYIPVNKYQNHGQLVLGWSGSHSTIQYLTLLKNVLSKLKESCDFKLLIIGDAGFRIEGIEVEAYDWSEDREVELLQKMDIGLYPLPDEEWVLGKSGLKALQYMSLAIPTVATAIGCNFRVIETGVSGFLVTTDEEWATTLTNLCNAPELRKRVGEKARERVNRYFSVNANSALYLHVIDSVLR